MMKLFLFLLAINMSTTLFSQSFSNVASADFKLGNGLVFQSGDDYFFKLSGMIQPSFALENDSLNNTDYFFNSKHTFFSFSGFSKKEQVSFLMLADFSLSSPLLDAWVSYHINSNLNLSFGQKLIKGNNREMSYVEDNLQFAERSILSKLFSNTGREFGLFLDLNYSFNNFNINPSLGVTSGDGRSSFGLDSRDMDFGGFKYFGRLDFYPFGYFSEGNNLQIADIKKEISPKLVFGIASSYNDGASNNVGEGHGDFILYNVNGLPQQPDYRQIYFDLLFKYQGFSVLGEYVTTSALSLEQIYTDPNAFSLLLPSQISEYLSLGSGVNFSLGYVFDNSYGVDLRYSDIKPEYSENLNSVISISKSTSISFSKYFLENNFKLITSISNNKYANDQSSVFANLILQLKL